jgi:tetratricopeptide (TPR) repeat protein
MILRVFALLFVVCLLSLATWYILRDTPQKRVLRLRVEARSFLEDPVDLESAEELSQKILQLVPSSECDLIFQAGLLERAGSIAGLREALAIYEKVLARGDPTFMGVALLQARICRKLGLITRAKGNLLSVADAFPFDATMELGHTALASMSPVEALGHYSKAMQLALNKAEEARAHAGVAKSYLLLIALNSVPSSGKGAPEMDADRRRQLDESVEQARKNCTRALVHALDFIKSVDLPRSKKEGNRILNWSTVLSETLAGVKKGEGVGKNAETPTPFWDGVVLVESKLATFKPVMGDPSSRLLVSLGAMRLKSAAQKEAVLRAKGLVESFRAAAEQDFLKALGNTTEEAAALLVNPVLPETGDADLSQSAVMANREYLNTLADIAKVFLRSKDFERLVKDTSQLALSQRIADVLELSQDMSAVGAFSLLYGFAKLRAGHPTEAAGAIDRYIESAPEDERVHAALTVAEQSVRLLPGDPIVLDYLEKFEQYGGKPFDYIGRRVALLVAIRSQDDLAEEAYRRLEAVLSEAGRHVEDPVEVAGLARILYSVRGVDASVSLVREMCARFAGEPMLERLLADLLFEKASQADSQGLREAMLSSYQEALGQYVNLLIQAPAESKDVLRLAVRSLSKLEDPSLVPQLKSLYSSAPRAVLATFSIALQAFLHGHFERALETIDSIAEPHHLRPFLPFLRASCHLGLASYMGRMPVSSELEKKGSYTQQREHLAQAREQLEKEPNFVAAKLELASLELHQLPKDRDVSDDLLKRIEELSRSSAIKYRGHFLLARALERRFDYLYDKPVTNSELLRLVSRQQKSLRHAIRQNPNFVPSYLLLADTYLIAEREKVAGVVERQLLASDYDRAIGILKVVAEPTEALFSRLAMLLERIGDAGGAARQLEKLAVRNPSADVFFRLLSNYVKTGDLGHKFLLAETPPKDEKWLAGLGLREPFLRELRAKFESLPERDGLRATLTAMVLAREEVSGRPDEARAKLRKRIIALYEEAVEHYDSSNIPVPLVVLNNLSWYLADETGAVERARAVELAHRGTQMVTSRTAAADIYDTYGWALYKNNRLLDARDVLQELIEAVDRPTFRYHLAHVLVAMRQYDAAMDEVQEALDSLRPFAERTEARRLEREVRAARRKAIGAFAGGLK